MSSPDLQRLQKDLATIRAATGVDLPFDRFDVRLSLIVGLCTLLPAVAGIAGFASPWVLGVSVLPFLAAVLGGLSLNYRACHPSKACPYEKRKEYRIGVPVMLACLPVLVGFHIWAIRAGAPAPVATGSVFIFLGLTQLISGLQSSSRRSALFPAIAAIAGGMLLPFCEYRQFWTLLWSGVGVSFLAAAVVMHRQLISRERQDDGSH